MAESERIRRSGFTFAVFRLRPDGPWYAGAEASTGPTREAAISAHLRVARADVRRMHREGQREVAARKAREAKGPPRCTLTGCSGARMTPEHKRTSHHRSAVRYAAAVASGEIRR